MMHRAPGGQTVSDFRMETTWNDGHLGAPNRWATLEVIPTVIER
jgi:hypothetical protein